MEDVTEKKENVEGDTDIGRRKYILSLIEHCVTKT
jgi:hypothetical protein